jgi:hypothetical protein
VDLYAELDALVRALDAAGIDYALCGGLALAVHGLPRATRDIDLLARRADLDRIREVVRARGFMIEALPMTFSSSGLTMQRFGKIGTGDPLMVDILIVDDALEPIWATRARVPYEQDSICVVSRQGLISLKLAAGRPQDLLDIQRLTELGNG